MWYTILMKFLDMQRAVRKTQPYEKHPVWDYNTKLASRDLTPLTGVYPPYLFAVADTVDELPIPQHPCVLKPNNGSGGKCVFLISPREDGLYNEVHTGEVLSWDEIKSRATTPRRKRLNRDNVEGPWLLEELLLDSEGKPLCNWQFYCFGGEPAVVAQTVQRLPGGTYKRRWYDSEWNDIGDIRPSPKMTYTPSLEPPAHPGELLRAARDVAEHIPASFIRVDLYDDPVGGPVFGEITPWPGSNLPFVPEWETKLGDLWYAAEHVV